MKLIIFRKAILALLLANAFCTTGCGAKNSHNNTPWDVHERAEMVARQIKARGIDDERVLNAMLSVERHRFVPMELERLAYIDQPLPIGEGQTISQPYIVALMTDALALTTTDRVFEVGTGSGYQAAVLSLLADEVYTVEIIEALADSAKKRLQRLGYDNVHVRHGDGFIGWPEAAPFNAIIITCAAPKLPEPLVEQLAEGGRLIVPLGEDFQMLTLYKKVGGKLEEREIIPVLFVPMKGLIEE